MRALEYLALSPVLTHHFMESCVNLTEPKTGSNCLQPKLLGLDTYSLDSHIYVRLMFSI